MPLLRNWCPLLGLAALSLFACKPAEPEEEQAPAEPVAVSDAAETFARQICAAISECSCIEASSYANEASCVAARQAEFQQMIDEHTAAGGTWNETCAGELVERWSEWACNGPEQASLTDDFNPQICPVLKGSRGAGADCTRTSLGDDCSEGLSCLSGICINATAPIPVGQVCEFEWDYLPCESGSYCDYDGDINTQICKPLPSAGDACDPNGQYLCGPSSQGLFCSPDTNRCERGPGAGEPCFDNYLCSTGNYCDGGKDFTCQAQFEVGDGCGADAVCPIDAQCISGICEANQPAVCGLAYLGF